MNPAEITAEERLVEYLETFQESGEPLEGWDIREGHNTEERPPSFISITAQNAGGELAHAGIYECDVRALIFSQADDVPLAEHLLAVEAVRGIFSGENFTAMRTTINDSAWACSGFSYQGAEEARDEAENKHGTALVYRGWFANL